MEVSGRNTRPVPLSKMYVFSVVRPDSGTTWHRILSFNQNANNYLRTLSRGSRVYVEANLEVREPVADAAPGSSQSMRQVFLRHGKWLIPWCCQTLYLF